MDASAPWGLIDARPIIERVGRGDIAVAAIAAEQEGLITTPQLLYVGLGSDAIHLRCRSGRLHRLHRGVYAVGHALVGEIATFAAAVLAIGPGAALSHVPAAVALKMLTAWSRPVDISLPTENGHRRSRSGIRVHRVRALQACDLRSIHRVPITTPARTLVDLAQTEPDLLEPALNEGRAIRLFTPRELERAIERSNGRCGAARLRALLASESDPGFSRNRAERMLANLLRLAGLPPPQRNRSVHGMELDFFWPEQGVNVELDGFTTHGQRRRNFERDRDRDGLLASRGVQVIRVTWWQLTREAPKVVARIAAALALRSSL